MCGIFGYFHRDTIPNLSSIDVNTLLHHRGPDDIGWLLHNRGEIKTGKSLLPMIEARLLLFHRRLSIVDLRDLASQPMKSENNRFFMVFNGEIYNHLEIKAELEKKGIHFTSRSDSEVLLKAYIHWGKACLSKLVGMFAFVIFDRQLNKLFLARDHFGIKPLYYFFNTERFLFSSEIKSLLQFLSKPNLNANRIFLYLRSGMTDFEAQTFFEDIFQLPAGHYAEIELDSYQKIHPIAYWKVVPKQHDITFSEATSTLRNLFLKSVQLHLRSDVPVAATLSGGIDSSSIVMAIRSLYPQQSIATFSYIAAEQNLSEEKWVNIVNQAAAAVSHKVYANCHSLVENLERLITIQDEPFGSTSIYAQHRIFETASRLKIKVMLDGQGADEMLGGYTFYVAARFASLLKQYKFNEARRLLIAARKFSGNSWLLRSLYYLLPLSWQIPLRKFSKMDYIPGSLNQQWFLKKGIDLRPPKYKYGKNVLHEELLYTFNYSSLPMLLRYEDRNSMAHSIESRVPFLTQELVEFIFSLPEHFLISEQGISKAVFREAMRGIVPDIILDRRDKIGFATPEKNWLTELTPWVEKTLLSDAARRLPMLNPVKLLSEWRAMQKGKLRFDARYWRWINFIKWTELHQIEMKEI